MNGKQLIMVCISDILERGGGKTWGKEHPKSAWIRHNLLFLQNVLSSLMVGPTNEPNISVSVCALFSLNGSRSFNEFCLWKTWNEPPGLGLDCGELVE